jgi:thiol-disulfide isomerase/thioredoxin
MKQVIISIFAALLFIFFAGCDKIEPPYKKDSTVTGSKNVLIEDYTGHYCVNCPEAAEEIHTLQDLYGDRIVVIAVHAGFQAAPFPAPYDYDFRTEVGTTWNDEWGISTYPTGVINRTIQESGNRKVGLGDWAVAVSQELNKETNAEITLEASYDSQSDVFVAEVTTNIDAEAGETYYINVVLTEDSIIQAQKNDNSAIGPKPDIFDYAHMHVLRASFTGDWGVALNASIVENKSFTLSNFPADLVPENCHVVAFVAKSNKEIVQVVEAKVE